jgi:hypothetical protein
MENVLHLCKDSNCRFIVSLTSDLCKVTDVWYVTGYLKIYSM